MQKISKSDIISITIYKEVKKLKKTDKKLFKLIILTVAVIVTIMILLPAYKLKDTDTVLKGYELAFGKELAKLSTLANTKIKFNIVLTLAYLLPLVAGVIAVMMKKEGTLISAILFLASGIMFILAPNTVVVTATVLGQTIEQTVNFVMTSGAIIACGLSFFGVLLSLYYYFAVK